MSGSLAERHFYETQGCLKYIRKMQRKQRIRLRGAEEPGYHRNTYLESVWVRLASAPEEAPPLDWEVFA